MKPLDIVVVDDDSLHIRLVQRLLRTTPHRAHPIDTARTAERCLTNLRPDIVFVDYSMPGMTGLDLIERLREQGIDAKLYLWSAAELPKTIQRRAVDLGVDILSKALANDRDAFLRLVNAATEQRSGSSRSA